MSKDYWDELTHYVFLAVAVSLFALSFMKLGKLALAKGPSGLQEAFA